MDDGHPAMYILIYVLFIVLEAVFFGFGAAIQNINTTQLEKDMEAGDIKAGRVLRIVNRPGRFVNTIQIVAHILGYITGGILLSAFVINLSNLVQSSVNLSLLPAHIIGYFCTYIIALVIMVSFGIVIPKRLAARDAKKWAYGTLSIVRIVMILIRPIIVIINLISLIVLKLFGIDMNKQEENVTEEDIMSMVNEGHEQGVLESSEAEMITNIFQLNDKEASDVMTHRKNIVAIEGEDTLKAAVDFMLSEGNNSRYPVYGEDVDDILGTLNMKDALIFLNQGGYDDKMIKEIPGMLREAHFIPETRNLDTLFKEMQSQKMHMVIVVDEYGQTAGIVTMEDILEEIVGNIMDEYDVDEENITAIDDHTFIMNGMTPLEDVAEALNVEFSEEDMDNFDTLNGFLISKLDKIPTDGEEYEINTNHCQFKVIHVENKMIHSVRAVRLLDDSPNNDETSQEDTQ